MIVTVVGMRVLSIVGLGEIYRFTLLRVAVKINDLQQSISGPLALLFFVLLPVFLGVVLLPGVLHPREPGIEGMAAVGPAQAGHRSKAGERAGRKKPAGPGRPAGGKSREKLGPGGEERGKVQARAGALSKEAVCFR